MAEDQKQANAAKKGAPSKEEADEKYQQFQDAVEEGKKLQKALSTIKHKLVIMSGKGGVGKSTVTVNLALGLAKKGHKVGIIDADITGPDVPLIMGVQGKRIEGSPEGLIPVEGPMGIKIISMDFLIRDPSQAVIWRGPLKMGAIKQFLIDVVWGDLDFLLVDLPPGTSDEPLSIAQLIKDVDGAIIITTPQAVSLLDIRKAITFSRAVEMPVMGIIENMSGFKCPHCGKDVEIFPSANTLVVAKEMGITYLGKIPIDPNLAADTDKGTNFLEREDSPASESLMKVIDSIEKAASKKK
jgi:Mrp family chromosome partitioning ATPase